MAFAPQQTSNSPSPRPEAPTGRRASLLDRLLERVRTGQPPAFALLHRPQPGRTSRLEVLTGPVSEAGLLADLPLSEDSPAGRHELLTLVPYRQIAERDFACLDDGEPLLAMRVAEQDTVGVPHALRALPDLPITLSDEGFDLDDEEYGEVVRRVITHEIGNGAGANFVIKRSFTATLDDYSPELALTIFRRLLERESGAYWTFLVHTGDRTFVGATPERHVSLTDGTAVMNPISGTYRYPAGGPTLDGVLEFLSDRKELEELYMVVDEELKMMAKVCDGGGRVSGPWLKEMARLAHTEYLIDGPSRHDVRDILRATLFAPTVTGSPLENACRVLALHEPVGRGYYSGVIALIGRDEAGQRTLDSSILIRTADLNAAGDLRIGVGATLVRHSDPAGEAAETRAKAAGLLAAIRGTDQPATAGTPEWTGVPEAAGTPRTPDRRNAPGRDPDGVPQPGPGPQGQPGPDPQAPSGRDRQAPSRPVPRASIGHHPEVRRALRARNEPLAPYWLERETDPGAADTITPMAGLRVLVIDAKDTFTSMLSHQLRSLGLEVDVRPHHEIAYRDPARSYDLALMGPGPGDPLDPVDPKIIAMRRITGQLLDGSVPFVSVCLGHQVLASCLGFPLARKERPSQGLQREIDYFGRGEHVGFYNTFAAHSDVDAMHSPWIGAQVRVSRDRTTGEVHALRGPGFASAQFHPESVLTRRGPQIIADMFTWALTSDLPTAVATVG